MAALSFLVSRFGQGLTYLYDFLKVLPKYIIDYFKKVEVLGVHSYGMGAAFDPLSSKYNKIILKSLGLFDNVPTYLGLYRRSSKESFSFRKR